MMEDISLRVVILSVSLTYNLSLTKTDSNGTPIWSELISTDPNQNFSGYDVQQTTDGGYVAIGTIAASQLKYLYC